MNSLGILVMHGKMKMVSLMPCLVFLKHLMKTICGIPKVYPFELSLVKPPKEPVARIQEGYNMQGFEIERS